MNEKSDRSGRSGPEPLRKDLEEHIDRMEAELRSVTEELRSERKLREEAQRACVDCEELSDRRFRAVPMPIFIWQRVDGSFRLVDYNDAASSMTGGRVEEMLGTKACEAYTDTPEIIEEMNTCYREKKTIDRVMEYRSRFSDTKWDLAVKYYFMPPDKVLVHAEDITDRIKVERELEDYRQQLEARVRERTAQLEDLNARLTDDIRKRKLAEMEAEDRNRELRVLNRMHHVFASNSETRAILEAMLDILFEESGVKAAGVFVPSRNGEDLECAIIRGIPAKVIKPFLRLSTDDPVVRKILDASPVHIDDGSDPGIVNKYSIAKKAAGVKATISFAVRSRSNIKALFIVGFGSMESIIDKKINYLSIISSHMGLEFERIGLVAAQRKYEERLKQLAGKLIESIEEERSKIALSLHDEIGQSIVVLNSEFAMLEKSLRSKGADSGEWLGRMKEQICLLTEKTRQFSYSLHPAMLEDLGLIPTLEWFTEKIIGNSGLKVDIVTAGFDERVSPPVAIALYRVAQEALTNVMRHSGAGKVSLKLTKGYPNVIMVIEDDGRGFPLEGEDAMSEGLGLLGMRERIKHLNGKFKISSAPGRGTKIRVTLPLEVDGYG